MSTTTTIIIIIVVVVVVVVVVKLAGVVLADLLGLSDVRHGDAASVLRG